MGRTTAFEFTLSIDEGVNRTRLEVMRVNGGSDDVKDSVRIVFRPDIEWRSFHASTKAYTGAENLFPESVTRKDENGFEFAPYGDKFIFTVENGVYHDEPQWIYGLAHPEEAARAQEPSGDVFSPGWVSADLKIGEKAVLCGEAVFNGEKPKATSSVEKLQRGDTLNLAEGLRQAMDLYIVRRNELKTVIAGYPWFLDWGRDTFIFMRGMIAAGMIEDSISILKAFAAFEEDGTLPNIIYGKTAGNRDTVDAQLWFIRCVKEIDELGVASKSEMKALKKTSQSIVENYFKGTPNGIKVDSRSGLVWTPSHFTWMDTNYPACTPRMGYPVEIQALWVSALDFVGRDKDAAKARESVKKLFRMEKWYCDCLSCEAGVSAFDAVQDDAIRPNQLFLVTLGVVDDKSVLSATEELLVPGGIRSLNAGHPLYKGVYEGDEDTSRKQAYHNGTVWAWPFPAYAEALVMTGICSKDVALSLLASAVENINRGALCHISEIADGKTPHAQKGCAAQAWSVSELLRVWLKLSS
jgi:predicted glycogen debranching enzyme